MDRARMDWTKSCSYDPVQKERFHSLGMRRLRDLARELGLPQGSYDVRSNKGGIAVSGEVTLHHDAFYVQISQPFSGEADQGILVRRCNGREDYVGEANNFLSLSLLDDMPTLAARIRRLCFSPIVEDGDEVIGYVPPRPRV